MVASILQLEIDMSILIPHIVCIGSCLIQGSLLTDFAGGRSENLPVNMVTRQCSTEQALH